MQNIQRYINENDQLARHLGIRITDIGPGWATARMVLAREHVNSLGMAHGGTLFTLADMAFAAASNSHGNVALGVQASIHYHRPVSEGELTAMAREISRGKSLASYLVEVRDESGRLAASFQGLVYRKQDPIAC